MQSPAQCHITADISVWTFLRWDEFIVRIDPVYDWWWEMGSDVSNVSRNVGSVAEIWGSYRTACTWILKTWRCTRPSNEPTCSLRISWGMKKTRNISQIGVYRKQSLLLKSIQLCSPQHTHTHTHTHAHARTHFHTTCWMETFAEFSWMTPPLFL